VVVTSYTTFLSNEPAHVVSSRIVAVLDNLRASSTVNEKEYKIKSKVTTARGPIQLRVQVFTDSKHKRSVAVFRRTQGDSMQYRTLFFDIRQSLSDIVHFEAPKESGKDLVVDLESVRQDTQPMDDVSHPDVAEDIKENTNTSVTQSKDRDVVMSTDVKKDITATAATVVAPHPEDTLMKISKDKKGD